MYFFVYDYNLSSIIYYRGYLSEIKGKNFVLRSVDFY